MATDRMSGVIGKQTPIESNLRLEMFPQTNVPEGKNKKAYGSH